MRQLSVFLAGSIEILECDAFSFTVSRVSLPDLQRVEKRGIDIRRTATMIAIK